MSDDFDVDLQGRRLLHRKTGAVFHFYGGDRVIVRNNGMPFLNATHGHGVLREARRVAAEVGLIPRHEPVGDGYVAVTREAVPPDATDVERAVLALMPVGAVVNDLMRKRVLGAIAPDGVRDIIDGKDAEIERFKGWLNWASANGLFRNRMEDDDVPWVIRALDGEDVPT